MDKMPTKVAATAPQSRAAASAKLRGQTGRFYFDREPRRTHLLPFTRESAADRRKLWKLCERLAARPRGRSRA